MTKPVKQTTPFKAVYKLDDCEVTKEEFENEFKTPSPTKSILHEMRDWILREYALPTMEAHHDGHPIEHSARRIYDKVCKAIEEMEHERI